MARKRTFPKVDPYAEPTPSPDSAQTRSRTSLKNERVSNEKALTQLVKDLLALNANELSRLDLSPFVVEALEATKNIKSAPARDRHIRRIRSQFRGDEWNNLRRDLDMIRAGHDPSLVTDDISSDARFYADQILVEKDPAISRYVQEYPDTDRRTLRRLMRTFHEAKDAKKANVRLQLEHAIQISLRVNQGQPEE
ncbi:MAG: DUF615 domain-containing protein [Polyangiaceae bacterium]|nr:DUF615 domain-containing protein [Polyangiaceae bacterium]